MGDNSKMWPAEKESAPRDGEIIVELFIFVCRILGNLALIPGRDSVGTKKTFIPLWLTVKLGQTEAAGSVGIHNDAEKLLEKTFHVHI